MLNICLKSNKIPNFTGRINAFRAIERLERMHILGGQNTESVKSHVIKCLEHYSIFYTNE